MKISYFSLLLLCSLVSFSIDTNGQTINAIDNYNDWGWKTNYVAKNDFITVTVVPDAGGRVLEYNLGNVKSLWLNPKEFGRSYTNDDHVKMKDWRNFGGYRLVPIPRDNFALNAKGDKSQRWPPPVIIGDAPYKVLSTENKIDKATIVVQSGVQNLPVPVWFGKEKRFTQPQVEESIQYTRSLQIEDVSSKVYYIHTLRNVGKKKVKRGIMLSSQHVSWTDSLLQDGENFVAYVPFDQEHKMKGGEQFRIDVTPEQRWRYISRNRFPLDKKNPEHIKKYLNKGTNWTGEVAPGIYEAHFDYNLMGGMHMISSKAWICYVDKTTLSAFSKTFEAFDKSLTYCEGGDVAIFNSGMETGYLETEIQTPIYTLAAGEAFDYSEIHGATKLLSTPILDVNASGIITKKLALDITASTVKGEYGTFIEGELKIRFLNVKNKAKELSLGKVSPLKGIEVNQKIDKNSTDIKLVILDKHNKEHLLDEYSKISQ
ncbi:hypothetical protein EI427_16520 [Flammeovirga pectinis]|uniref:DUF4380 domain-containing protein n=1 Tax=Flammeovirga pectinis TaxID=2494373 RepID=A0A3S9P6C9_9BACT|nr:hypothetical protein [Flammeovirga pectinis]AZQ63770.1 hypothetical protein EI427_16520 [Flammeovirga pectinis]